MGWTYQAAKFYKENGSIDRKAECDAMCKWESDSCKYEVLKSAMKGSTYYAAIKRISKADGSHEVFAAAFLTATAMRDYYNFGYKDMDESCGPCEDDCPKSILTLLTPTDSKYAIEWRERCWANLKEKKSLSKVKIGEVIEFQYGADIIRVRKMPPAYQFKTPWYSCIDSNHYIKKNHIKDWKLVEAV